jgi:hypothetical protein
MSQEIKRRTLRFETLDDAVRDARMLQKCGYDRAGKWDLSQVCGHLSDWLRFPLDGPPPTPVHLRFAFWLMRNTVGGMIFRRIVRTGQMPAGGPTLKESIPAPGGDESAAVENLQRAVTRFQNHTGPTYPSPVFGELDRDQRTRLQLVHCAHHLGFLLPKAEASASG